MAYPVFPDIQKPSYSYSIEPEDPGIISKMTDGFVVSRPRYTKSRSTFSYHWNAMLGADWDTLFDFYKNTVRGSSMICTFNGTNGRITSLKASQIAPGYWGVDMNFQEA